jgi:hypothetical protein
MMVNDKFLDFDKYMEERGGGKFEIKAFGETHQIPNDVPFDVILKISRAYKDKQKEMSEEQVVELANTIFGEETFNQWLKKGIGLNGIMFLTEKVMEMYMSNATEMSNKTAEKGNTP